MPERMTARDLPDTLKRSSKKARDTFLATYNSAAEQYGDEGDRARRTAFASLKHSFEKVEDRWVKKDKKGPSDPQSSRHGRAAIDSGAETFGGVDYYGNTKDELMQRAARLDIRGRSRMTKAELARAIARKQG
jgi:cation transport regulator ChaB